MKLSEAVQQVGPEENIEAAFIRLYGGQTQPEQFRRLFNTVRKIPAELLQKIQEHADLAPDDAFKTIYPDHVNIGEFMTAVLESRKPSVEPEQPAELEQPEQEVVSELADNAIG